MSKLISFHNLVVEGNNLKQFLKNNLCNGVDPRSAQRTFQLQFIRS